MKKSNISKKEDRNIISNYELLDSILEHLIKCENYQKSYKTLIEDIYKTKLEEEKIHNLEKLDFDKLFDTLFTRNDRNLKRYEKLKEAISYLEENNFIKLLPDKNYIKLTYYGIIQYSKSFVKTYEIEKHKSILDVYSIYINLALTIINLLIVYFFGKN